MPRAHRDAGQDHRREHDDEERPEVVDEVRLHRRGKTQRDEEQEVKTEQPVDAERERARRDAPRAEPVYAAQAAHEQRGAGEQERRPGAQAQAQRGEHAPEGDGRQRGEEGGACMAREAERPRILTEQDEELPYLTPSPKPYQSSSFAR